jgi:hypothetical protein
VNGTEALDCRLRGSISAAPEKLLMPLLHACVQRPTPQSVSHNVEVTRAQEKA